jgi:hypothetical protein
MRNKLIRDRRKAHKILGGDPERYRSFA